MNKSLLGFLSLSIALLLGALYYTNIIQKPLITALNNIKINYHKIIEIINYNIEEHMFQSDHIKILEKKISTYESNHLVMQQLANEISDLFTLNKSKFISDPKVKLVRTISYQKFGNFNRIWLDISDYNSSKIYGLTYKELVAGIVISKNGNPLGLLNKDIKSSYAVYIGKNKAPGIAHGNNTNNLLIKFIPAWFSIKTGDEVITSGLDEIFFKGLKVGKVISVTKAGGYQNALVEPYFKSNIPNYFYMIKKIR